MKNFTKVEICHLGPDCDNENESKKRWEMTMELGSWKKHVNAGGCLNYKGKIVAPYFPAKKYHST